MNNKAKGILGAVGAAAIGVGAYFGFSGGEDVNYTSESNYLNKEFDSLMNKYNETGLICNTDDDVMPTSNEEFINWSWQKFLWLTSKEKGKYKFMTDLKQVTDFGKPYTWDYLDSLNLDQKYIKRNEDLPLILSLTKQADATRLPAIDNELVYYSIHATSDVIEKIEDFKRNRINEIVNLIDEADPNKRNFNDTNVKFENGATEIKLAWAPLPENKFSDYIEIVRSNAYKTKALVRVNELNNLDSLSDYSNFEEREVFLLGIHVFTVTEGQPAGIWSTFELDYLSPNKDKDYLTKTHKNQLLFEEGQIDKDGIEKGKEAIKYPLKPYSVYRNHPGGVEYDSLMNVKGDDDTAKSDNKTFYNTLNDRNNTIKSKIKSQQSHHYTLAGSIWVKGVKDIPTLIKSKMNIRPTSTGSLNAANVTMESTFQGEFKNCFMCHSMSNDIFSSRDIEFKNKKGQRIKSIKLNTALVTSHLFEKSVQTYAYEKYINENKVERKMSIKEILEKVREDSRLEAQSMK